MTTKTDRWPGNEFKPDASIIVTYQEKKNKCLRELKEEGLLIPFNSSINWLCTNKRLNKIYSSLLPLKQLIKEFINGAYGSLPDTLIKFHPKKNKINIETIKQQSHIMEIDKQTLLDINNNLRIKD